MNSDFVSQLRRSVSRVQPRVTSPRLSSGSRSRFAGVRAAPRPGHVLKVGISPLTDVAMIVHGDLWRTNITPSHNLHAFAFLRTNRNGLIIPLADDIFDFSCRHRPNDLIIIASNCKR